MQKYLYSILSIFLLFFIIPDLGHAQALEQDKVLDKYNGESEIKAKNMVILKPGFRIPAGNKVRIFTRTSFQAFLPYKGVPNLDQNFISTKTIKNPKLDTEQTGLTLRDVSEEVQYFDGLGRTMQTVYVQSSPAGNDLVQPVVYDDQSREKFKYLPYSALGNNGNYHTDALQADAGVSSFYNPAPGGTSGAVMSNGIVRIPAPFAETVFETSPLDRVIEHGATGDAWQLSSGHTQKTAYLTNMADDAVKLWKIDASGAKASAYWVNTLFKTVSKDENWVSGKPGTTEEYKDIDGHIVLKRIWESEIKSLSTYYVYDDLSNLRYVLPPAVNENGQREINSFSESDDVFDQFIYGYHYDGRNRIIEKKIPGKEWEYLVYNKLDQVVFSQDGNQRDQKRWQFTKYNAFGNVIITGLYVDAALRASLQTAVDDQNVLWEEKDSTGSDGTGYTYKAVPASGIVAYTSINYYDDYNFPDRAIFGPPAPNQAVAERTKTLLTASKVNILTADGSFSDVPHMLLTVNYYDNEARVVQSKSQNHLNGTDIIDNTYNFAGELTESIRTHKVDTKSTTIATRYEYDHRGRKLATMESINGQAEIVLSKFDYNELGQLQRKNLHSADGIKFLQNTELTYNERGWLKNSISDQFSLQLKYNDSTIPQFNGNISGQFWGTGTSLPNSFSYNYDKLNRLVTSNNTTMAESITYDVMGNINTLSRDGGIPNQYHYIGNKLISVDKLTGTYAYGDKNGNVTNDGRNGMVLTYNYLNLPATAKKSDVNISYLYNAEGIKLRKVSNLNGTTDYVGGIHYQNNVIELIETEEGVARNNNGGNYSYEYNLSDHLGNVRYTFNQHPETKAIQVLQRDDYYAFGLRKVVQPGNNKYLYNKKELQDELGQYDYGARFYDPVIGRFTSIDPVAEHFPWMTSYQYASNNPVKNIDLDGLEGIPFTFFFESTSMVPKLAPLAEAGAKYSIENIAKAGGEIAGETVKGTQEHHILPRALRNNEFIKEGREGGFKYEGKENKIDLEPYSKKTGEGRHGNHPKYNSEMEKQVAELSGKNKGASPAEKAELLRDLVKDTRELINNNKGTKVNDLFKPPTPAQDGTKVVIPYIKPIPAPAPKVDPNMM